MSKTGARESGFQARTVPQPPHHPIVEPTYLTDTGCGFCTKSMDRALRTFPNTFVAISYWEGPLEDLGLDLETCQAAGHFLIPLSDGTVRVMPGSLSWAGVLQVQPSPLWRLAGTAMGRRPVKWVADVVYRWVAGNRYRFGGGSGGSCAVGGSVGFPQT